MENLTNIAVIVGSALLGLLTIGLILARLYRRASKETSFVRTGMGGQKVIMNAGAMVLPVLHEIIPVNMNMRRLIGFMTMKIEAKGTGSKNSGRHWPHSSKKPKRHCDILWP